MPWVEGWGDWVATAASSNMPGDLTEPSMAHSSSESRNVINSQKWSVKGKYQRSAVIATAERPQGGRDAGSKKCWEIHNSSGRRHTEAW